MPYVGIMGGTFDPIHFGHLAAAEGARHLVGLDRVLFMPNRQPPHKAGHGVSPAQSRAEMVLLAIAGNPYFEFSDLELRREGPSYTLHTLQAVQAAHPDWQVAFLAGMDSLMEIQTWYEYRTVLKLADFIFFSRPGYATEQGHAMLATLGAELTGRVRIIEVPGVAVSASALRAQASGGYPLRYLIPDAVAAYIARNGLYTEG